MSLQDINLGTAPNNKTGDGARTGGQKINANFHYLEDRLNAVNALVSATGFTLVSQTLTVLANWQWKINSIDYTNAANVVFTVPFAASGKQRIDLIVMNTSNTFQRIPGTESTANPVRPAVPANTLEATIVLVNDGLVNGLGYVPENISNKATTIIGNELSATKYPNIPAVVEYVQGVSEQRTPVNDANYTISGTANRLVSFTALTADRSLFLPPATTPNQRIRVADESFTCSGARRILIVPNGSDTVSGGINSLLNFPGAAAYIESNGAGKWTVLSTTAMQLSAGVNTLPSITDNTDGTVTVGSGVYALFANTDGSGRPKSYSIAGGTFTMVNGSLNYIIAKYDTSASTTSIITSVVESDINSLSSIKVFSIYRQGTVLFIRDNDRLGLALSNKLQRNAEQTNNIRVNSGTLLLSESATRIVNVSAGTAWIGGNEIVLSAVASSTANTMFFVTQTAPGVWDTSTFAASGQYNNTQYNPPSGGLSTLANGRYAVIFVFRSLGQGNKLAYVLGQGNYTLGEAQIAKRPDNLPLVITSQMIPVGRIIILKSASTATQIDKISDESYAFSGVTDHESLSNLLGGDSGGRFHVTQAEKDAWNLSTAINYTVVTGSFYTILASDNNKQIVFTSAAPVTVTIPSGLFEGHSCECFQYGTGKLSFIGSGVTLKYASIELPETSERYSIVGIDTIKSSPSEIHIYGQLASI